MEDVFQTIWENYNGKIRERLCVKMKNDDECKDVLQEVYIKIFSNLDKVKESRYTSSYIFRIVDNTLIDHFRKKNKQVVYTGDLNFEGLMDEEEKEDILHFADCCLRAMIGSLDPIYREALELTEFKGFKLREYAVKTGISLSNAKARVVRAREKLKEKLLGQEAESETPDVKRENLACDVGT